MASEYERIRLRNIEDNKRILAELGLVNPYKPLPRIIKRTNSHLKRKRDSFDSPSSKRIKTAVAAATPEASESWTPGTRRRSRRLRGKDASEIGDVEDALKEEDDDDEEDEDFRPKISKDRPQVYGAIPGVEVGTHWMFRMEANRVGVHRPVIAGIHPGPNGAYSIALSGGYEDDLDYGECFTYTGEGGRDLKGTKANPKNLRTAPQSKHQSLSRGNKALVDSVESGLPVRVLRGYKLDSPFAPEDGYRYDGLYKVDKWWYTGGMAGFSVYKFALSRLKDEPPPPWYMNTETGDVTMSNADQAIVDSKSKEVDEKKEDIQAAETREEADTNLLKEKRKTDNRSSSSTASDDHGNKEQSNAMKSELVSEDEMARRKLDDPEKNEKSDKNCDSMVSDEFANNISKSPDEMSSKNENMFEHDTSMSPSKGSIKNKASENDTSRACVILSTNNGDMEDDATKSCDRGRSKKDDASNCDVNSTKEGIDSNGSSQNLDSVDVKVLVLDETESEQLPTALLSNSVDAQNAELLHMPEVVHNNVLLDDNHSQDSGLGITQPQTTSDADVGSMDSDDAIPVMNGKLEVVDENRNITGC